MGLRKREDLTAREGIDRARSARRGFGSTLYVALVVACIAVAIGVSAKFRSRFDATELRELSLTPKTVAVLESLTETVAIRPLFTSGHPQRRAVWDLLGLYRRASDEIDVVFIDPIASPGSVQDLGVDLAKAGARRDGVIVVKRGERSIILREISEEAVTNGILEVGSRRKKSVGIVRGYGEADADSKGDTGLNRAVEALRSEYYDVQDVDLTQEIPPEITVCLLAGPTRPIPPADLERLAVWIAAGGRLFAMLDPGNASGANPLLEGFGLRLSEGYVLDTQENHNRNFEFVRVREYSGHPIVKGFGKMLPTAFPLVGSVDHFETGDQALFHEGLLVSSPYSVEIFPDGRREQGPFELAAASWKRLPTEGGTERELRVVLVADAGFALNAYLPLFANRNFFLNCVGWLAAAEGLVTIRRQPLEGQTILLERDERWILYVLLFGPPTAVLLMGAVVFIRRRGL